MKFVTHLSSPSHSCDDASASSWTDPCKLSRGSRGFFAFLEISCDGRAWYLRGLPAAPRPCGASIEDRTFHFGKASELGWRGDGNRRSDKWSSSSWPERKDGVGRLDAAKYSDRTSSISRGVGRPCRRFHWKEVVRKATVSISPAVVRQVVREPLRRLSESLVSPVGRFLDCGRTRISRCGRNLGKWTHGRLSSDRRLR